MATQHDVARETGLSQTTISRVLRDDPAVTGETRAKVIAACEKLGYRPSIGARMLVRGRAAVIGLSLSSRALPTDRYVSLLHQSLALELSSSGWGARLIAAEALPDHLAEVGALVLVGVSPRDPRIAVCRAAGLPLVAIGYPAVPGVRSVVPDDADGARLAITHLVRRGRRRLALLSSLSASEGDPAMRVRREAALATAETLGVPIRIVETTRDASSTLAGYRAVALSKGRLEDVDGLFCDSDEHALGALSALRDLGVDVPRDVSVVGFDDIPGLSASLTTVRQDFRAIARAAIAICRTAGEPTRGAAPAPHVVPVELIERRT